MAPTGVVVINLGGEGEPVDADVVLNVNLLWPSLVVRPSFTKELPPGQLVVAASAGLLPFRAEIAQRVVAHCFPVQFDRLVDGRSVAELAAEVARVLRRGGDVEFHCSSCDGRRLVDGLVAAFGVQAWSGWRRRTPVTLSF